MAVLPNPQLMMLLCLNILCPPFPVLGCECCVHTHFYRGFCPEQQRWSVYVSAQSHFPNQAETSSPQSLPFLSLLQDGGRWRRVVGCAVPQSPVSVPLFLGSQSTLAASLPFQGALLAAGCILGRQWALPAPCSCHSSANSQCPMAWPAKGCSSVDDYLCDSPVMYSPGQSWHSALIKS